MVYLCALPRPRYTIEILCIHPPRIARYVPAFKGLAVLVRKEFNCAVNNAYFVNNYHVKRERVDKS